MEKILIIGGTNFIGRNLVERLITLSHYDITLLNRGQTNTRLFSEIKLIKGDRNTEAIKEQVKGDWDYIIDLSCYFPKSLVHVLASMTSNLKKYIFISTCSVYELGVNVPLVESAALKNCKPEDWDDQADKTYGQRKVACEQILQASDLNYTILRPALVYGKYDHTDRFYYWLHQVKKYQKVLIPNEGYQKFSVTYIADLIRTITQSINPKEDKNAYNIISFSEIHIRKIVEEVSQLLNKKPNLVNVPAQYLYKQKITQWIDMPLWIDGNYFICDNQKMLEHYDLMIVPFEKSLKETISYYEQLNWPLPKYGVDRIKQLALINNYNKQK